MYLLCVSIQLFGTLCVDSTCRFNWPFQYERFGDEHSFMSSSKRDGKRRADAPATQMPVDEDGEELEYEDEYGDEFEEEIIAGGEEGEEGEEGMEISASEMLGSDGVHA